MNAATEAVAGGLAFTEAPRWHDGRLYFSDIPDHRVAALGPDGVETVVELDGPPSGLGWSPEGVLLVVHTTRRAILRADTLEVHSDLAALTEVAANDMVVDGRGRAYVSSYGFELRRGVEPQPTHLVAVDPDGRPRAQGAGLLFPNGVAVGPAEDVLIVAETFGARLTAFSIAADGSLSEQRTFARFDEDVAPDGICLDAEGCVWVADARGEAVLRVGDGGEVTDRVTVSEGRHPYACMLGGEDGRTLYVCAAVTFGQTRARELRSGQIEAASVAVPRAGWP